MKMTKKGFTLIELMIVVAIIGILAAIAVPKFADLINKSKDGATRGTLSAIKGALQIYYGDNEGAYPVTDAGGALEVALIPKYLAEIKPAKLPGTTHGDSNGVVYNSAAAAVSDAGGWYYYDDNSVALTWGNVVVNCTHEDVKNASLTATSEPGHVFTAWSTY